MSELRVAVLGVGMMGADHVARITSKIAGARVSVVNDYVTEKAEQLAASIPGCRAISDPLDAIADPEVDAIVLATPGPTHEKQLLACLEHGKPVMCEKPLTTDVATSLEVVKREAELGKRLIQVGFMRRFDHEYEQLKSLIDAGELGRPLVMHCAHRNPEVPPNFDSSMIVKDSLVHEVDVTRFLFDEEITSVQIVKPSANPAAPEGLQDPQIAILRDRDGQARRRRGVRHHRGGLRGTHRGRRRARQCNDRSRRRPGSQECTRALGRRDHPEFQGAFRCGLRRRDPAVGGRGEDRRQQPGTITDGPGAWDGYAAAAVCAAGVQSLETGQPAKVEMVARDSIKGA